jgi:hypothetical protein
LEFKGERENITKGMNVVGLGRVERNKITSTIRILETMEPS